MKATTPHLIEMIESRIGVGDQLIIAGSMSLRQYTRNDGSKGMAAEVFALDIRYNITKKTEAGGKEEPVVPPRQDLDDEIPF